MAPGPATDPKLEYSALLKNPNFRSLTTNSLRNQVRALYPNLDAWEVNISAGNALENAYGAFTRYQKGWNMLSTKGDNPLALRTVRPDFIHSTILEDADGNAIKFTLGGVVEVKVPQNPIDITTNNSQIDAELNLARYASGDDGFLGMMYGATKANELKGGAYTLVLPAGAQYDQRLVDEATRRNVNFYVSYAFQNINDGSIVFSNPQKINNISNEMESYRPGTINKPAPLNLEKATRWAPTRQQPTTNNDSED